MQMQSKNINGYITIFISMVFTILLSLILLLVDGVGRNASRVQAKMVAKLGVDSCMAEYSQALWEDYDELFIDYSYGTNKGNSAKLKKHMKNYVDKNCEQKFIGRTSFLKLKNPYLEIEDISFATDSYGLVWKKEAVNFMKTTYGIDAFTDIFNNMESAKNNEELFIDIPGLSVASNAEVKNTTNQNERNLQDELDRKREEKINSQKNALSNSLGRDLTDSEISEIENDNPREIADLRHKRESTLGFCVQDLTDKYDEYVGKGIIGAIIPGVTISGKTIERDNLVTTRITKGNNMLSATDEILFNEYLFDHFGYFGKEKEGRALSYEIEYILSGRLSDDDNLRAYADKLLLLRMASNYAYIKKDLTKQAQLQTVAAGLAAAILAPEAQPAVYNVLQGMWVYAESFNDLKILFKGGKVPLYKTYDDWMVSLEAAYKGAGSYSESGRGKGLDYKGYLRIFLYTMLGNDKAPRSMDLVEQSLGIKLDNCVYSFKACFGFVDDRGHSFVLNENRSYE